MTLLHHNIPNYNPHRIMECVCKRHYYILVNLFYSTYQYILYPSVSVKCCYYIPVRTISRVCLWSSLITLMSFVLFAVITPFHWDFDIDFHIVTSPKIYEKFAIVILFCFHPFSAHFLHFLCMAFWERRRSLV